MKINPYISLLVLLGVLLAACAPQVGAPQAGSPQAEAPQTEAPQAEAPQTQAPQTGGIEQTLYIGPQLVDCVGVAPQKCLQVKDSPDGEYRLFYDQIEGFEFEEGKEFVLSVSVAPIENPPADGSNMQYRLLEVISSAPSSEPPADSGTISSGSEADSLEGQVWNLTSYVNSVGAVTEAAASSHVTAEFKDGQVSGSAGCNSYSASYQVDGSSIQIGEAASTMMFCEEPEGVMDQEAAYLKALSMAASFQISNGLLQIADADGNTILVFGQAQPASLTGSTWQMSMVNNGTDAVVSALEGAEITAIFGEDGSLTGSAGCNRYMTTYQQDGSSLTIAQAASTMMMCTDPEGVMEQEAAYLKALESVASFELLGDRLTLRTASGAIAVEYSQSKSIGLSDTSWSLSLYYVGGDAVTSPLVGTEITANFSEDGKLTGSTGCNNYFSSFQVDGDSLSLGPVGATKMACPEPPGVMDQETAFLAILDNTRAYKINVDRLFLLDANGAILAEFTASPLLGVVWKWQQYLSNDESVQAPADPGQYTLEFMNDGTVAIQADCNRAAGTYTLEGSQLDIEIGPVTLMLCPEGSLSEEYLRLLGDVVTYLFEGENLFLDVKFDSGTMKFSH